jgi:uncharacterized protein (TIGR00299 family) protein
MCLGALVDAGAPMEALRAGLRELPIAGYRLSKRGVKRGGLRAVKVDVLHSGAAGPKRWVEVRRILRSSELPLRVKERSEAVFRRLFEAEGHVHGVAAERVRLHELGSVDTVVDVVGTMLLLEALEVERVFSSDVNVGSGAVSSSHGVLPVPAPATAELLKGVPVYASEDPGGERFELATPTGAAILSALCEGYGMLPAMDLEAVGTGAGGANPPGRPNVLRVLVGRSGSGGARDEVVVMETDIDDMDPRIFGHVAGALLKAGALDVTLGQIIMKKGRPGGRLTVLCEEQKRAELSDLVLRETTTLGVRYHRAGRTVLDRSVRRVETPYGALRVKEARLGGRVLRSVPEYEDCARAARRHGVPLAQVMKSAEQAADASPEAGG